MNYSNNIYKNQAKQAIDRLTEICHVVPDQLKAIREEEMSHKSSQEKWSKKEIIGHLIDSATNNHHRFIRAQFEELPAIQYDQDNWNRFGYYQAMESNHLIEFWRLYNLHLTEVMKRIPEELYRKEVLVKGEKHKLDFLMVDYVAHLEHHLGQVLST